MTGSEAQVDFIEELQLRRWARENFVDAAERDAKWSEIVHDEMRRRDLELSGETLPLSRNIVPLRDDAPLSGAPHLIKRPHLLSIFADEREMHYT